MREPLFLTLAEVIDVHTDQITRYGGEDGVRDPGQRPEGLAERRHAADRLRQNGEISLRGALQAALPETGQPVMSGGESRGIVAVRSETKGARHG